MNLNLDIIRSRMKGDSIYKTITKTTSWRKFHIQWRESREKFIYLLHMSTRGLLRCKTCFKVRLSEGFQWMLRGWGLLWVVNNLMIWFEGSGNSLRRNLSYNFFRWRWIGISPMIASIPSVNEVQKAPIIQMAALYCIFLKILSE